MESIISTFHIDWKIIIAQMINFAVVFVVLYIFALKPLNKLMKERGEKIEKGLEDSKLNQEILQSTKKEYEEVLSGARIEANKIFQESKKEALDKKNLIVEDAKIEVTKMIENGKKVLETEKIKIVEDAKKEIVSLTGVALEKLITEKGSKPFNERAVKELSNL